ncbi:MAG: phage head morphogenesis protein [Azonexus sp.]|jgi:hypothetical protein|nr:phage head morphogenesis protein [Azonexus sp.]
MATSPSLQGAFNLPFTEQIEFFRRKLNLPTERWDDIVKAAHDRAFVVAGAMKADLLNDLRQAIDKGISGGTGLKTFREDFAAIVAKHGWTGWTGEDTAAGRAWRTRVIFETNLSTSYAAGRWQQLNDPELQKRAPYWRYVHNDSAPHPRPQHQAWGDMRLTLRYDHPFWQTHYPPNGWGCRCRIVAVHAPGPNDATEPPAGWDAIDPKTGAPVGIDKGWDYAPGANAHTDLQELIDAKTKKLPPPLAAALRDNVASVLSPQTATPATLDEFIAAGQALRHSLPDAATDPAGFQAALAQSLSRHGVSTATPAVLATRGAASDIMKEASMRYPDSWTAKADAMGKLSAKGGVKRGFYFRAAEEGVMRVPAFGKVDVKRGDGFIALDLQDRSVFDTAIHEYAHRLQEAMPELDALFQALHQQRTRGDPLKKLRTLRPGWGYETWEKTREDHYIDPYWGKEYEGLGALEVMSSAFQTVFGHEGDMKWLKKLAVDDPEMLDFVVGLLHHWKP